MADQASMRGDGPGTATGRMDAVRPTTGGPAADGNGNSGSPGALVGNLAGFGEDLLNLAELQSRLGAIELRQNLQAARIGSTVIACGAVLALAAIPVVLAGIAELLVSYAGMNRGIALIAVAVATMAIAGTCIAIAVGRLRASGMGFPLTREEFIRNINWIRTVLVHSGRSPRARS
jgi:Putative Actinobacterial Holin-X, holin superfamily III